MKEHILLEVLQIMVQQVAHNALQEDMVLQKAFHRTRALHYALQDHFVLPALQTLIYAPQEHFLLLLAHHHVHNALQENMVTQLVVHLV